MNATSNWWEQPLPEGEESHHFFWENMFRQQAALRLWKEYLDKCQTPWENTGPGVYVCRTCKKARNPENTHASDCIYKRAERLVKEE